MLPTFRRFVELCNKLNLYNVFKHMNEKQVKKSIASCVTEKFVKIALYCSIIVLQGTIVRSLHGAIVMKSFYSIVTEVYQNVDALDFTQKCCQGFSMQFLIVSFILRKSFVQESFWFSRYDFGNLK